MGKIAQNLIELIGHTPLVRLNKIEQQLNLKGHVIVKLEAFNPGRSVKDRIGRALIEDAEARGLLTPKTTIIEPTSGNTGIGLALVAAIKGYRLILTMPASMSLERRSLLKALGAELVLTPAHEGMSGAIRRAEELAEEIGDAYIPQQFKNYANPDVHRVTTGREIWQDTEGKVDIFIAGIGTGGTITGVGEQLKSYNSDIKVIAVEPNDSPVLAGGKSGPHKLQGIGAGFVPKVLNTYIYDEIYHVKTDDAFRTAHLAAEEEGILAGISSGAALYAAIEVARRPENEGKNIVVLLPDTGERYLSTQLYNSEQ